MNVSLMVRDARPTGGIWTVHDVATMWINDKRPILIKGSRSSVNLFQDVEGKVPWGSAVVFSNLSADEGLALDVILDKVKWRRWSPAGVEAHETCYVKSSRGGGYDTHQEYLRRAVELTTGPVLELGCGEGSTPMLHATGRAIVSIDNNQEWLLKYSTTLATTHHEFFHDQDPGKSTLWGENGERYGVVFVDHAPGETRKAAVERARNIADFCVIHDAEDVGYQIWETLESFKYKRHFRFMRPWTSVVSMTREIFESPYPEER